jgi:hypothetical protein
MLARARLRRGASRHHALAHSVLHRPRPRRLLIVVNALTARLAAPATPQAIFSLSPSADYKEFSELVNFLAQARPSRAAAHTHARNTRTHMSARGGCAPNAAPRR